MNLKCKLGLHNWSVNCEKCSKCGLVRKGSHDWKENCELCSKCGTERKNSHDWLKDCRKCQVCGLQRDVSHDWSNNCELCNKCSHTRINEHDWSKDCNKCSICSYERIGGHEWESENENKKECGEIDICVNCNETREYHSWERNCEKCSLCGKKRKNAHDFVLKGCRLCSTFSNEIRESLLKSRTNFYMLVGRNTNNLEQHKQIYKICAQWLKNNRKAYDGQVYIELASLNRNKAVVIYGQWKDNQGLSLPWSELPKCDVFSDYKHTNTRKDEYLNNLQRLIKGELI